MLCRSEDCNHQSHQTNSKSSRLLITRWYIPKPTFSCFSWRWKSNRNCKYDLPVISKQNQYILFFPQILGTKKGPSEWKFYCYIWRPWIFYHLLWLLYFCIIYCCWRGYGHCCKMPQRRRYWQYLELQSGILQNMMSQACSVEQWTMQCCLVYIEVSIKLYL